MDFSLIGTNSKIFGLLKLIILSTLINYVSYVPKMNFYIINQI